MCDLRAAHKDLKTGNGDDTCKALLHDQFRELCAKLQIEHWIDDTALPVADILKVYGYQVRHGHWSNLPEVRIDSVSAAW